MVEGWMRVKSGLLSCTYREAFLKYSGIVKTLHSQIMRSVLDNGFGCESSKVLLNWELDASIVKPTYLNTEENGCTHTSASWYGPLYVCLTGFNTPGPGELPARHSA